MNEMQMILGLVVGVFLLIFLNTASSALGVQGTLAEVFAFIGSHTIAVAAGLILPIYTLAAKETREDVLTRMEEGVASAGIILLITVASISAPILASLNINPVFATMSACVGAMVFSYFNDSFFWVVTRMVGVTDVKEQFRTWSTTILWATI